jgi:glycosyltransferase involved in cell wall biosynthesis
LKPVIVQHSFGDPGSGGPIGALERLLASRLADDYTFVRMHQDRATGGVNLSLIREWVAALKAARPDIVHVRGLGNEGFQGALAARLAGCPNILVSIHGTVRDLTQATHPLRRGVLVNVLEPATLRMATDVVAVCEAMEHRSFLDPVRRKVRDIVPNGVEVPARTSDVSRKALRAELDLAPDQFALVAVGRLSVEKGHLDLARALALCDDDVLAKAVLVLVGDGPDRESILAAYSEVPRLQVRALGRRHDVAELLQVSDVFVFPTLHENLSNALLEAMAVGVAVIATAVGGNVEVLSRGGGVLVAPGDHAAMAKAVSELTWNANRRADLGAEGREVVASAFTLDHMVAAWDQRYRAMLSKDSGR